MKKIRKAEFRTIEKGLVEKRVDFMNELEEIVGKSKAENRTLSDDENKRFAEITNEIEGIDNTLNAIDQKRALDSKTPAAKEKEKEQRVIDEENFIKFIKGEERALDVANNGGIIPVTIANKIIESVKEKCPIYRMATVYNVGGDLVFPVYDETTPIQAAYVDDLTELTEQTGKFTTVKLQNFIVGCLSKISKSLMNRTDFDLVGFVVNKVAQAIADFLEKECLIGTASKMTGVFSATQVVTTASISAIVADELIDLQDSIPDVYQTNACWIMNKATRRAIRKFKNADGEYLLNKDITTPFGYMLLGKPVYTSDVCPIVATGNKVIAYGDMSGLVVKLSQNVEIQVLIEKYATQHAIGVVGYIEADSKIVEPQKIAIMKMK